MVGTIFSAPRGPAVWQCVAEGMANYFTKCCVTGEIAFSRRVAPCSFRIPVPRFRVKLRILTICHWLPAGSQNLLQHRFGENVVCSSHLQPVDSSAQCPYWAERVHDMGGSCVNGERLRHRSLSESYNRAGEYEDASF